MRSFIKAAIIDDEPGCISNLEHYLAAYCPDIKVTITGTELCAARQAMADGNVDVFFLDIALCEDNVFDLLDEVHLTDSRIVFVTAYNQYAIRAFKVDALDYMLKPLHEEDVLACYQKIKKWFSFSRQITGNNAGSKKDVPPSPVIALRQGDKMYIVKIADVLYFKAKGLYTEVGFLYNGAKLSTVICKMLNRVEKEYSYGCFFRVHKSFIVNIEELIVMTQQSHVRVKTRTGDIIPVAKRRVHEFLDYVRVKHGH